MLPRTYFGILFSPLLLRAVKSSEKGVFLCSLSEAKLYNLATHGAKTSALKLMLRGILFTNDAAMISQTHEELESTVLSKLSVCAIAHY